MAARAASQAAMLSAPAAAPIPSKTLAEAKARAHSFYRTIAREIPWIMKNYQLEEITTAAKLRSQLADIFRTRASPDSRVIDILLFKGQAEVTEVLSHYYQRHHLITKYVSPVSGDTALHTASSASKARSDFLNKFLRSNSTEPVGSI